MKKLLLARAIRTALVASLPLFLLACNGDDGKNGVDGVNGQNGADGQNGVDGANGQNGTDGQDGANGQDGQNGTDGVDGSDAGLITRGLTRLATVPAGAEVTGAFLTEGGDLFFNVQHPDDTNAATDSADKVFNTGTVGVLTGVNINSLPKNLVSSPVPKTTQERETVQVAYGEYQVIAQTGDQFGGSMPSGLGTILDSSQTDSVITIDSPDFNGFVSTTANEGYLFTNWEAVPGGMSRLKMSKNATSGLWSVDESDVMMIDFGTWGTIANCFGSVSPWGTPLTSEEWGNFGDNTHMWNNGDESVDSFGNRNMLAKYTDKDATSAADAAIFPNTYRLHYIVEIQNPTSATPMPVKHYTLGRFEHENSIVMPDQRTVYLSQDSTDGVFYKFVADVAGDLSAGTLYAAKLTQDAGSKEPLTTGFDITWIELASSNNTAIENWVSQYDSIDYSDYVDGKSSYLTDADAIAWANNDATYPSYSTAYTPAVTAGYEDANTFGGAVTAGQAMDDRIAFLESRKAARAKGATAEFRKFEGIYVNQKRAEAAVENTGPLANQVDSAYVYFAIADLDRGMIDDEGDIQLSNRVKDCGGVYRMELGANYDVTRIEPVVMGSTYRSSLSGAERCDVNGLSQPDNVIVMDDGRIILGEDGFQENNTLWLYDPSVND